MSADAIREAFRAFTGENRFKKFVRTLNTSCLGRGRLFFWQEQLWQRFVHEHPGYEMPFRTVDWAFHFCDLHGCELRREVLLIRSFFVHDMPEYTEARDTIFPYGEPFGRSDPGLRGGRTRIEAYCCTVCREQAVHWASQYT